MISSLDVGYQPGDLSVFPNATDNYSTLYQVSNNAETTLSMGLPFSATIIFVEDASAFPPQGLIRIGPDAGEPGNAELIYYGSRTSTSFFKLQRGFAGSVQTQWSSGAGVTNAVMAETHNAVKDAMLNMESYLGTNDNPAAGSFNANLHAQEVKFLTPQAEFFAYPTSGVPPLTVRFQNFSGGDVLRNFWDFGDGGVSTDTNPTHTFNSEGIYTVQLNVITSTGGQASANKSNYITVSETLVKLFFYVLPINASTNGPWYSEETAASIVAQGGSATATEFQLVDQTDGDISERYWIFADGSTTSALDPDAHTTTHTYASPGTYNPSLLLVFADNTTGKAFLSPNQALQIL